MAKKSPRRRLKIQGIDVDEALESVRSLLENERDMSPALKSALDILLVLVAIMVDRLTLNSRNSSKPPSLDPNRKKDRKKRKGLKKPGGQKGHVGTTLQKVDNPDEVKAIKVDRRTLPIGRKYQEVGTESRQVIEIEVSRFVIEYQAQILEDDQGKRFVAPFPDGVVRPVQYGHSAKSHAVYLSQFQLLPYDRIRDHFSVSGQTRPSSPRDWLAVWCRADLHQRRHHGQSAEAASSKSSGVARVDLGAAGEWSFARDVLHSARCQPEYFQPLEMAFCPGTQQRPTRAYLAGVTRPIAERKRSRMGSGVGVGQWHSFADSAVTDVAPEHRDSDLAVFTASRHAEVV